ncbi:hypothetical protein [Kribbella sp. NPDC003557]|uniref:hypothetical protein n=1 Tax=Kribbella sp. NPDC003557 TaxID=3154449 RepID=UPI0033BF708A
MHLPEILSLIAVLVAVGSAAIAYQIGRRSLRITTYRSATDLVLEVDRVFIEHPELRPYFYDSEVCAPGHQHYNQVMAVAELELDVLECIWDARDSYSDDDYKSWAEYIKGVFETSPAVSRLYADNEDWYPTLDKLFTGEPASTPWYRHWTTRVRQTTSPG